MAENDDADDGAAADAGEALRELLNAAETLRRAASRRADLTGTDLTAIGELAREGSMTPRQLATRLGAGTATVTALIDRLERAALVTRSAHPTDRRSVLVTLTPHAHKDILAAQQNLDALVSDLPDLPQVTALLTELAGRLRVAATNIDRYLGPLQPDR